MNKKILYWIFQIGGWATFIMINGIMYELQNALSRKVIISLISFFILGILITHIYRWVIIKLGWLNLKTIKIIPRVLLAAIISSAVLYYSHFLMEYVLGIASQQNSNSFGNQMVDIINITFVFIFWSLIYFLFHYIQNYRRVEIENLKWQASINEIELNKLKSQLNPHFIFNAMNSIRALIDEDQIKAKNAVTHLSSILRNTLQMGKKKLISFDEELSVVKDYLELESVRYEERLKVKISVDERSNKVMVPPLMIQTLVENAIKHGISKLPQGGELYIKSTVVNNKLHVVISNEGTYVPESDSKGFGIKNTVQRLELLFGKEASYTISNENGFVVSELVIPQLII